MNPLLKRILQVRRPSGSQSEMQFAAWVVQQCSKLATLDFIDEAGNISFTIGESRTIFAAHLDTVCSGDSSKLNKLAVTDDTVKAEEHQLGADDGAGIYLLMSLMQECVPGRYIFTRGEECGGIGAEFLANNPIMLDYDRSICFDRRGTTEVITHQAGDRGASDAFAEALCSALNETLLYMPSDAGVFTDNAMWLHLIPENVNIAVGYNREHSKEETQNLQHLEALKAVIVGIDWENLPTERDCGTSDIDMTEMQNACFDAATGFLRNICQYMAVDAGAFKRIIPADWYDLSQLDDWEIEQILEEYIEDYLNIH